MPIQERAGPGTMQRNNLTLRRGLPADCENIAEIEKLCFAHPWTKEDLIEGFQNFTHYFVAETEGEVVGYCGMQALSGEGYITNVATLPRYRGMGIATDIISELLKFAVTEGLEFVTLEVRESNLPAINLYSKMGFESVGKRPNFYRDPKEDALLMTKFLK